VQLATRDHTKVHLDRKTGLQVLCGSCGEQLAEVTTIGPPLIAGFYGRVLYVRWPWTKDETGMYSLTKSLEKRARLKQRPFAGPRRSGCTLTHRAIYMQSDVGSAQLVASDFPEHVHPWLMDKISRMESDRSPTNQDGAPAWPIRIRCFKCHSLQTLEAERLRVDESGEPDLSSFVFSRGTFCMELYRVVAQRISAL
jgi:hypothetical protein